MRVINKTVAVVAIAIALLALVQPAWAGENEMMDILVHKLVQKGVLTKEEGREIRQEVAEESAKMSKARESDSKDVMKSNLSGLIAKTKWSGDLRLRHESQFREPAQERHRERMRLRFGFVTKPWDPLEVGVRLATGASGDPVSTNQSFSSTFDKKAIFVDQAYAKYTPWLGGSGPLADISVTGGKMENPFVTVPENNFIDGDVTPEGAAIQYKAGSPIPGLDKLISVTPFFNAGAFQISELSGDNGDPAMFGAQVGSKVELPFKMSWQPSVAFYDFTAIEAMRTSNVTNAPAGNSTDGAAAAARFRYDYDLVDFSSTLNLPPVFGQPVSLIGNLVHNTAASDDENAWLAGLEVGKVTEKFGSWKGSYFFKSLEPDAVFGAIADSDFGAGGTNHRGHIFGLQLGLNKYASAGVKYFRTDEIEGTQNHVDTLQVDTVLKF